MTLPALVLLTIQRSGESSRSITMHETMQVFKMATLIAGLRVDKFDLLLVVAHTDWMQFFCSALGNHCPRNPHKTPWAGNAEGWLLLNKYQRCASRTPTTS